MKEIIDILIVHLNGEEVIRNCLSSIYKNSSKNIRVCVLLNKSEDNSKNLIENEFKNVKILESKKRIGFAQACNMLAKKSNSKYVVFLNNDVEVERGWLDELLKTMKNHKNCVACQPKIKSYDDRNYFEFAGAAGGFIDVFGFHFCRGRIFDSIEKDLGQYDDEIRIFWGCGVCLLVDREFFVENGMFDEDFFMYVEEADFCWRANLYGKEIWFSPKSVIYHIGSFSSKNKNSNSNLLNARNDYFITRNHLFLLLKNYSWKSLIFILPAKFFLDLIGALRFFPYKTISFLQAYLALPLFYFSAINHKRKTVQKSRKISDRRIMKMMYPRSIALAKFLENKKKFTDLEFF